MKRILITTSHNRLTGVTTFNYTLGEKLKQLGYDLHFYIATIESASPLVQDQFTKLGKVFSYDQAPLYQYDILIFSDNVTQNRFKKYTGKKIFIVHGLVEKAFLPILELSDKIFCVSSFMTDYYQQKFRNTKIESIPNFINTKRFKIESKISEKLQSVLILDFRFGSTYAQAVQKIADKLHFKLTVHGVNYIENPVWEIEKLINQHDLIVAYGRSAYEAMACGRNVIVFGKNGGDGFMNLETLPLSFARNCSGWGLRRLPKDVDSNLELMETEFLKYDSGLGNSLRNEIVTRASIDSQIQRFIDLAF